MIRRFRDEDLDAVLGVWERSARDAYQFLDEAFFAEEATEIQQTYMPTAETWVAEVDGLVAGFIALLDHEVGGFFVDPSMQGSGIGRELMDHARGLKGTLELSVFEKNALGRRFYKRYGFEAVGEEIEERTGERELRLRLPAGTTS